VIDRRLFSFLFFFRTSEDSAHYRNFFVAGADRPPAAFADRRNFETMPAVVADRRYDRRRGHAFL
jgi:hypothetical protein